MIRLAAIPPPTASRIAAGSAPSFEPSTSASARPPKITATSTWLQAFATCPAPASPTWVTREPSTSKTGRARSTSAALAADHDRERPVAGADVAAGDRRVEEADAARRRLRGELAGQRRGDGAHVDHQGARARRGDRPVGTAEDLAERRVVAEDRDQDVGLGRHRGRPVGAARPGLDQLRQRLRAAVPGDDLVLRGEQVARPSARPSPRARGSRSCGRTPSAQARGSRGRFPGASGDFGTSVPPDHRNVSVRTHFGNGTASRRRESPGRRNPPAAARQRLVNSDPPEVLYELPSAGRRPSAIPARARRRAPAAPRSRRASSFPRWRGPKNACP